MSTLTRPEPTTDNRSQPQRRSRLIAVLSSTAATLAVWAIAGPLIGVDLTVAPASGGEQHVGPVSVAVVTTLAGLAGWAVLALLERMAPNRARSIWTVIALTALVVSLAGPLGATTTAATVALLAMHMTAAAVLIPALSRSAHR